VRRLALSPSRIIGWPFPFFIASWPFHGRVRVIIKVRMARCLPDNSEFFKRLTDIRFAQPINTGHISE